MILLKKGEQKIVEEGNVMIGSNLAKGTVTLTNQRLVVEAQVGSFMAKKFETILNVELNEISNMQIQKKGMFKPGGIIVEVPVTRISSSIQMALSGGGQVSGQLQAFALQVKDPEAWGNKIQTAISES